MHTALDDIGTDTNALVFGSSAINITSTHEGILVTGLSDAALVTSGFADVLTAINLILQTAASGDDALVLAQGATDTAFYVYTENGTTINQAEAGELRLLAVADNEIVATTDVTAIV